LIAARGEDDGNFHSRPNRQIASLAAQRQEIDEAIAKARTEAMPLRQARAALIATALEPERRLSAVRLLAGLTALRAGADLIEQVRQAIERAGGGEGQRMILPDLGPVEALARRIAGPAQ
jgi:hypothetical protein